MKILVVAPHADDETLGAGGTIARMVSEGHEVTVAVMTGHGSGPHPIAPKSAWNTVRAEAREAMSILGVQKLIFREIPAGCVREQPLYVVNEVAAKVVEEVRPEMLFVPFLWDLHQDHREIFHTFSVAWRVSNSIGRGIREIYAYETLSETHWNTAYVEPGFFPNVHFDISNHLGKKLEALGCYKSQIREAPSARSIDSARAQAVWRGAQIEVRAAEAFVLVRKLV